MKATSFSRLQFVYRSFEIRVGRGHSTPSADPRAFSNRSSISTATVHLLRWHWTQQRSVDVQVVESSSVYFTLWAAAIWRTLCRIVWANKSPSIDTGSQRVSTDILPFQHLHYNQLFFGQTRLGSSFGVSISLSSTKPRPNRTALINYNASKLLTVIIICSFPSRYSVVTCSHYARHF